MILNAVLKLYDWQEKIENHEGNITIRGGRQTGKSISVAKRIYRNAIKFPGSRSLIIAASERQENFIYQKVKDLIGENYKGRSTLSLTNLKNGSQIYKFPVGQTGKYLEGLSSVDFLYADEAIHIGQNVWDSIIPMLAEPRKRGLGWITLLSSTRGKMLGFFYESFQRKDFLKMQIKAEDCEHISKEFLESEKKRLGERFYNVIYNGEFDEHADKYFSPDLIDKAVRIGIWEYKKDYKKESMYFLGIDPARFGKSKAAFAVAEMEREKISVIHGEEINKSSLMELKKETDFLDNLFNFKKIYIDDGGFGAGLVDILTNETSYKRKIIALNNSASGTNGKILKEDLYSNLLRLLETEKINLLNDEKIIKGLKEVCYSEDGKIEGTDLSEAITRACWAMKEGYKKVKIYTF